MNSPAHDSGDLPSLLRFENNVVLGWLLVWPLRSSGAAKTWHVHLQTLEYIRELECPAKMSGDYVQNFRIFLPAGDFRRFEIKQKKLIREIQKIPTVFVSHSF